METHTGHVQNKQPVGIHCKPQGAHTCPLQQDRGVGGLGWEVAGRFKWEGHMYTYDRLTLIHGRNQHNIVKQLSPN